MCERPPRDLCAMGHATHSQIPSCLGLTLLILPMCSEPYSCVWPSFLGEAIAWVPRTSVHPVASSSWLLHPEPLHPVDVIHSVLSAFSVVCCVRASRKPVILRMGRAPLHSAARRGCTTSWALGRFQSQDPQPATSFSFITFTVFLQSFLTLVAFELA
jgi:hypothetical protein